MRSDYIQQGVQVYNGVFSTSAQAKGNIVSDKLTSINKKLVRDALDQTHES